MSTLLFANNASTTLAGSITNTAITFNVQAGGGALFPNPATGQYFVLTLVDAATGNLKEIMQCTGRSGDTFTVVRAQEGTTALAWNAGDLVNGWLTAGMLGQMLQVGAIPVGSLIYYGVDATNTNTYAATITPAIASVIDGMVFEVSIANTNSSQTVTFNPSALGAMTVYRVDGTLPEIGDIGSTSPVLLLAKGGRLYLQNPAMPVSSSGTSGTRSGYVSSNDGTLPNVKRNITASAFTVTDVSGRTVRLTNLSLSVNSGVAGAGGLDTGLVAASTVYYTWIIAQAGGASPAALLSLSATTPALPAGYVYYGRGDGAAITDSSKNFYRINVLDRVAEYIVTPSTNTASIMMLAVGSFGTDPNITGTPTWATVSTATSIPASAVEVKYYVTNSYNSSVTVTHGAVAPNANYGGAQGTNPPPIWVGSYGGQSDMKVITMQRESATVYIATQSGGTFGFGVVGWTEGL